jgi:cell division ATPase FtsA
VRPLATAAGQLVGTLQSTLRFSSAQTGTSLPAPTRIVLTGAGSRLRGLETYLGRAFGKPAEAFQPMGLKLSADGPAAREFSERPGDFGVAVGLATAGLRAATAESGAKPILSLLPAKYVRRREFRDRTLFLYAAGVLLVLVLVVRFAHGYVRSSAAASTHRDLVAARAKLEGLQKSHQEALVAAEIRKSRLNRLLREAEMTSFQAHVLDLLSRVLGADMQLDRVYLDDGVLTADGTASDYTLHVEGRVSTEKLRGRDPIGDLQETLRRDERIGSVEEAPSGSDRVWRSFKLLLRPNYVVY